jgi:hypothetical protein
VESQLNLFAQWISIESAISEEVIEIPSANVGRVRQDSVSEWIFYWMWDVVL